jgi:hypothetical protein
MKMLKVKTAFCHMLDKNRKSDDRKLLVIGKESP